MLKTLIQFNPFQVTGSFLYHLRTLENHGFYDIFKGYRKRPREAMGKPLKDSHFIQAKIQKPFL